MAESTDEGRGLRPGRRRIVAVVAVAVVVVLAVAALVGALGTGAATPPAASPAPRASQSGSADASALLPVYPDPVTADTLGAESVRVADLMVGFIDASESGTPNVVNDDAVERVTEATAEAPGFFGVLHTLTLDPSVDATAQVTALQDALVAGGWRLHEVTDDDTQYLAALDSVTDPDESWFVVIGVDRSVPGESVATIQMISPNLP